jgi:hypothetical protein
VGNFRGRDCPAAIAHITLPGPSHRFQLTAEKRNPSALMRLAAIFQRITIIVLAYSRRRCKDEVPGEAETDALSQGGQTEGSGRNLSGGLQ